MIKMNKIENIEKKRYIKLLLKDEKIRNLVMGIAKQLNQEIIVDLKVLAERFKIPYSKAWRVVNFLQSNNILTLKAKPNFPALGLTPALFIVESQSREWKQQVEKMLYLRFASQAYGKGRKLIMLVAAPPDTLKKHIEFIEAKIGKIVEYYILEHAVIGIPNLNFLTMDKVPWEEIPIIYYDKIRSKKKFDKIDISIIASLEKRAPKKVSEISEELKLIRKTVEYRMKSRVSLLLEGFQLKLSLWHTDVAPFYAILVKSGDVYKLSALTSSVYPTNVYVGKDVAFAIIQLPCKEKVNFARFLSTIGDWEEYILEYDSIKKTLPVKAVKETGTWMEKVTM